MIEIQQYIPLQATPSRRQHVNTNNKQGVSMQSMFPSTVIQHGCCCNSKFEFDSNWLNQHPQSLYHPLGVLCFHLNNFSFLVLLVALFIHFRLRFHHTLLMAQTLQPTAVTPYRTIMACKQWSSVLESSCLSSPPCAVLHLIHYALEGAWYPG